MLREMLRAKIHRATITQTELDYEGSLTVDMDLQDAAGMRPGDKVQVVNINNGSRMETYLIAGERGKGDICLNGAAARLGQVGDKVIIIAYGLYAEEELDDYAPAVVHVDTSNSMKSQA